MSFLNKLIKVGKRKLAGKFNHTYRYAYDIISFNNERFKEFISDIYPKNLSFPKLLSLLLSFPISICFSTRDENKNITTKLYDKHQAFGFNIVKPPFTSSNIPPAPPYMSMYPNSFTMPVGAQTMSFVTPKGPGDKSFVTRLQG